MELDRIIEQCKAGNSKAQKQLYEHYSGLMLSICYRYLSSKEDAEDVFIEGMFKIFNRIKDFKGDGSFEGWMKRIMVNQCLMHIRKNKKLNLMLEWSQVESQEHSEKAKVYEKLAMDDLKAMIEDLPVGYRTVFNLYVMEGYKHREIAELLGISINTSKSQLILAKKRMRSFIKKKRGDERVS